MRTVIRAAIILIFVSGSAFAKGKKAAGAEKPKSGAGMMDANDPAEKETSDQGPFAPKAATGEQAEEQAVPVDAEEVVKARARDKVVVFGNVLVGFGKAPEPGVGADKTTGSATSVTFMAGGRYDVTPELSIGLRLPFTAASVREFGVAQSSNALGTPELMAEYRVTLSPLTRLPILFGVGRR